MTHISLRRRINVLHITARFDVILEVNESIAEQKKKNHGRLAALENHNPIPSEAVTATSLLRSLANGPIYI